MALTSRQRELAAAGLVSLIGLGLVVVSLAHWTRHPQSPLAALVGTTVPTLLALSIVVAGPVLATSAFTRSQIHRLRNWTLLGIVVGAIAGVGIVGHLALLTETVVEGSLLATDTAILGAASGLVVGYYEVTGRRRADSLAESHARFEAVFEGTHDALVIAADDGTYVAANPAAADLFGLPTDDLVGLSIRDFAAPDFDFDAEWSAFRQEKAGRGQFQLVRPDGTSRTVEFAATSDIYPGHHLSALRDVTDRVTYEQELEQQRETLAFLNRMLRHNVLNGLHVTLARADLLAESATDEQLPHVDAIRDRSDRIVDHIDRVKQLKDTMWDGQPLEHLDVSITLRDAIDVTSASFPAASITAPESLPDDVFVEADPMLHEVFENLLVNAVVHDDSAAPDVSVSLATTADSAEIRITDTGPGLSTSLRDSLLGDGDRPLTSDASGFGLYIVRTLVDRYDGSLSVADNEPTGTVFTITFPRVELPPVTPRKRHP